MFTTLSGSLPFLEAELDYRRERLLAETNDRRRTRAVRPRRRRRLRLRAASARQGLAPAP